LPIFVAGGNINFAYQIAQFSFSALIFLAFYFLGKVVLRSRSWSFFLAFAATLTPLARDLPRGFFSLDGYEYSISAFAEISKKFPNLKYVIVGRGPEREALKLQITNYKLQNKIIFLDNLNEDELIALYQNAELFILLPQDIKKDIEGFGLVFLEAAAAGLPVIGTKASSAEDALLDGRNGILAPQKDFNQASDAMVKILSNTELKKSFSQESLKFAKAMNWERVAQQYSSLYHNL